MVPFYALFPGISEEGRIRTVGYQSGRSLYLLGSPFEHIHRARRPESYVVTQILDLCSVLENKELFDLAMNEFLAVNICLPVLEVGDGLEQYPINSSGQCYEPNLPYQQHFKPIDGWKTAPHHGRGPDYNYPESMGAAWDQLAISCVVRDRHFVKSWRRLIRPAAAGAADCVGRTKVPHLR
jgi:hypothetical protein